MTEDNKDKKIAGLELALSQGVLTWQEMEQKRKAEELCELQHIQYNCRGEKVYDLLEKYLQLLQEIKDQQLKAKLEAFWRFVDYNAHIIKEDPDQVIPLAYNRAKRGFIPEAAKALLQQGRWPGKGLLTWREREDEDGPTALVRTIKNENIVYCVVVSSDGEYIASGGADKIVRVWKTSTGKELRVFLGHTGSVNYVAISHNSKYIISGSVDNTVRVWELATGKEVIILSGHTKQVASVAISSDDEYIISGSSDNTVRVWELKSGKGLYIFSGHTDGVEDVAISHDGQYIVSGSLDKTIRVWDLSLKKQILIFSGHTGGIRCVAISHDGHCIVSGSDDKTARVWDIKTGDVVLVLKDCGNSIRSLAFNQDDNYLVSGCEGGTVRLWEMYSGKLLQTLSYTARIWSVAFHRDNRHIFFASAGYFDYTILVYDFCLIRDLPDITGKVYAMGSGSFVNLDGRYAFYSHENAVYYSSDKAIIHVQNWPRFKYAIYLSDWNDTSGYNRTIHVCELSTGKEVFLPNPSGKVVLYAFSVAISQDGSFIVSGINDTMRIWEFSTGQEICVLNHPGAVLSVAITQDNRYIISASSDKKLYIWELATKSIVHILSEQKYIYNIAISSDSRYVVYTIDLGIIKVFEFSTEKEPRILSGHTNSVTSVAISHDSRFIVSGSDDNTVRVWDLVVGKELRILSGHTNSVRSVAVSEDDKFIISSSYDKTLRLWEFETGRQLYCYHVPGIPKFPISLSGNSILYSQTISNDACTQSFTLSLPDDEGRFAVE